MTGVRLPLYQYRDYMKRVKENGVWSFNERTGKNCLTLINHDMTYDVAKGQFPLDTTRKSYWKAAAAEIFGYARGERDAVVFKEMGANTWMNNASAAWWRDSVFCDKENYSYDMGRSYGVQGNEWKTYAEIPMAKLTPEAIAELHDLGYEVLVDQPLLGVQVWKKTTNQLKRIWEMLKEGKDDRRLILNFFNPGEIDQACLPACMYSHHFSLLDGVLYLNSTQRSCDITLGVNFNMVQVYVFLYVMAWSTGNEAGQAFHKLVNNHFYEDQIDTVEEQLDESREPLPHPIFRVKDGVKKPDTFEEFLEVLDVNNFEVLEYQHHEPISHKFTT
ncbi:thymidylate synthase [Vibrio phage vB_VcorM_GR7B]|nr:thymidylate synthase [Vibrio phage vB_VcorM_GR7B]